MCPKPIKVKPKEAKAYQLNLEGQPEPVQTKRAHKTEEAQHQACLFLLKKSLESKYPILIYIFSTLNGLFIPPHLLAKAREAGLQKGVLDIWLPLRRIDPDAPGGCWSGIVIDLKRLKRGQPTPEQREWANHLIQNGYRVYFCAGCVDAWWTLCSYIGLTGPDHFSLTLQAQENLIRLQNQV